MKLRISLDEDDPIPCVCKLQPLIGAYPEMIVEVDAQYRGLELIQSLLRAGLRVSLIPPVVGGRYVAID